MQKRVERKDVVFNKIKRASLVIFLKKVLPFVIFLVIVLLSFVVGLWNVKEFEYERSEFENVSKQELDLYLSEFKGVNIFLIKPSAVQDVLVNENGYIKRVWVKKILPSKLGISIEEYTPFYSGYSLEKCMLFSSEGTKILDVCEECEDECPQLSLEYSQVYITSNSVIESSKRLIFFEEIASVEKILSLFGYTVSLISIEDGVAVFEDTDGHTFIFDIAYNLELQLSRLFLVSQKIDSDMIEFRSIDLRFDRPVMKLK